MSAHPDSRRSDLIDQVVDLMRSAVCVWCEQEPAAETSYLCPTCALQDPEGVLRKPSWPAVRPSGRDAA